MHAKFQIDTITNFHSCSYYYYYNYDSNKYFAERSTILLYNNAAKTNIQTVINQVAESFNTPKADKKSGCITLLERWFKCVEQS